MFRPQGGAEHVRPSVCKAILSPHPPHMFIGEHVSPLLAPTNTFRRSLPPANTFRPQEGAEHVRPSECKSDSLSPSTTHALRRTRFAAPCPPTNTFRRSLPPPRTRFALKEGRSMSALANAKRMQKRFSLPILPTCSSANTFRRSLPPANTFRPQGGAEHVRPSACEANAKAVLSPHPPHMLFGEHVSPLLAPREHVSPSRRGGACPPSRMKSECKSDSLSPSTTHVHRRTRFAAPCPPRTRFAAPCPPAHTFRRAFKSDRVSPHRKAAAELYLEWVGWCCRVWRDAVYTPSS